MFLESSLKIGWVEQVTDFHSRQEIVVNVHNDKVQAVNYPDLTGPCAVGDQVTLNTTAVDLKLGTGGWHYVLAIYGQERSLSKQGHIMKLRYTPLQGRVLSVEEEISPYHEILKKAGTTADFPTAVGSLHSMLTPFTIGFKSVFPEGRIVYLMSDGAALPIAFSKTVDILKKERLIEQTITFGHAFGGDLEAVNVYSALLAAKYVYQADAAVILMGPGVVGTGTKWGTTGLEQGEYLNAVTVLKGIPIAILRMSEAEERTRHRWLSHHTLTVLQEITYSPCYVPLPNYAKNFEDVVNAVGSLEHNITWVDTDRAFLQLLKEHSNVTTMGRSPKEDPLFFHAALAAGISAAQFGWGH